MVSHQDTTRTETYTTDTPADTTAEERTADVTTFGQTTPEQTNAEQTTPEQTNAGQTTPEQTNAARTTPEQADADRADAGRTSAEYDSVEHASADQTTPEAPTAENTVEWEDTVDQGPTELSPVSTTAGDAPLFATDEAENFQVEWRALQAEFVDDPREAVQRADELVAQVVRSLTDTFAEHKHALEEQWQQGEQAETEELRLALKRYRAFFDRLLSV